MTDETSRLTADAIHRETHSSRAVPSVILAGLLIVACLYVMLEAALKALGQDPWLTSPEDAAAWVGSLPGSASPAVLAAAGALIFIVGLIFLLAALLPGRRARLTIPNDRAAVVVDAEVLASSLARRARLAAGVAPEQVLVTIGRRLVDVQVRPTSGTPVSERSVREAVEDELVRTSVDPIPEVRVAIAESGVIGQ
ncbi:hypothetical protein GC088_00825 [Arthrobacter sp. JZ12]|uniref:DUF6286 domain-containing protein n=1 Tax=Arthrobacter sp. JZ12 TaxID=2654190 RepID=UPI002B48A929|nr:DUF6286 domain-containing protein [Arthrobacter sp. JZ12]WRH23807.1 hypothetical protein GC088_00825 [Arthrobacter sp. JZ12]